MIKLVDPNPDRAYALGVRINKNMKPQNQFKTRKAAIAYLTERGWVQSGKSLGEVVMSHPTIAHRNLITPLQNGSWRLVAWDAAAVAVSMDGGAK